MWGWWFFGEGADGKFVGSGFLKFNSAGKTFVESVKAENLVAQVVEEAFLAGKEGFELDNAFFEGLEGRHGCLSVLWSGCRGGGVAKVEGVEDAVENTCGFGDGNAVVGDRNVGGFGLIDAPEHKGAVDHAATTVDDEGVATEVFWKVFAGGDFKVEDLACLFTDEGGDFNAANVFVCSMMGAGFCNKDGVVVFECADGFGATGKFAKVAFEAGHEDGVGGGRNVRWEVGEHFANDLGVADGKVGGVFFCGFFDAVFGNNDGNIVAVEGVT